MRHLIVGTAGHIDHGKSALVKALTGVDPDRLKDEQARGITIELGFADLELGPDRAVAFVDVPGHERFVRHMVAGATGIDAVLLVISADEGVKPQTREHLEICNLLEIRHGVVALSKRDLVDDELVEVASLEVREFLEGSFLEHAAVVAVSARDGGGMEELVEQLGALFDRVAQRTSAGVPRLPVDRSFVLRGFGTVVTGSLASGLLEEGQEVEVLPRGARGRVRGLQVHHRPVPRATAGQRTAVNLQGLGCDDVPRGSTVTVPGALATTRRVWARLKLLPGAPERLLRGGPVQFHQGTTERAARLRVLEALAGRELRGEIFLAQPAVLLPGDRFILRRPAPVNTVGGGVILDVSPPHGRRHLAQLAALESAGPAEALLLRLARAGISGAAPERLARELGIRGGELAKLLEEGERDGSVVGAAGRLFTGEAWSDLERRTLVTLADFHEQEALRQGMSREELRAKVGESVPQEVWRLLLDGLERRGEIRLAGDSVSRAGHEVVLDGAERALAERIERRFREARLDPPELAEVLSGEPAGRGKRIVDLLIAEGRLVKIRGGRLFHAEPLAWLIDRLRQYARTSPTIDVAAFKELAGVTRKNAIPLLEHLDERRLTRRVGNLRELSGVRDGE